MPTALVVGGGDCVWRDAAQALRLFSPDAFFIINDQISRWPLRIDYAVTLHPDKLRTWLRQRRSPTERFAVWTYRRAAGSNELIDHITPDWAGSSGLFAVKVALEEKFDAIVLAGVPMEAEQNHFMRGKKWTAAQQYHRGWLKRKERIAPHVRSMSGWTKEQFGLPSPQWLQEHMAAPPDEDLVRLLTERTDGLTEALV